MSRILILIYAVACYLAGNLAILYAIAFVGDFAFVTHTVNRGAASSLPVAIVIDLILLGLFAVQHSVMARPAFKRMWTRIVPPAAERATYVLLAGVALGLLYLFWRPIPGTIWTVTMPAARIALWVVFWAGWATLLVSTFLIDHFELFGLSQAFAKGDGAGTTFKTPGLYKLVRHPIYLGLLLAFWAAPTMSASRLLFAVGATGYILVGIWFEERDLIATFGDRYRDYRKRVSMLLPWPPAPETKP
jgi:protein-S-isoprenylcysteine O-methyltransferase Ste14